MAGCEGRPKLSAEKLTFVVETELADPEYPPKVSLVITLVLLCSSLAKDPANCILPVF